VQGAQQKLHDIEKEKFISTEVPALLLRMRQLGVSKKELIAALQAAQGE
jgi:GntR family transcriptional regulator